MKKKELPSSYDTERAAIGCMLSNKDSLLLAVDVLDRDDFFFEQHKLIYDAIKATFQSGRPADVHIVAEVLKSQGILVRPKTDHEGRDAVRISIGTLKNTKKLIAILNKILS